MASRNLANVRAAALDGRASSVFYRQSQLKKLHEALITGAHEIQNAISKDSGVSITEAKFEYSLALEAVRAQYSKLDSKKEMEDEYRIANGKNAEDTRVGFGTVVIEPSSFTLFYSVIAPLSAAIAAGNCVIVQLENTIRELPSVLKAIFQKTLDPDAFVIIEGSIKDEELNQTCLKVIQVSGPNDISSPRCILSNPSSLSVAIVERSADFDNAARALINARFAFRGKSPYAPDLVLVNEFVKKEFLQALARQLIATGNSVVQNESIKDVLPRVGSQRSAASEFQSTRDDDARLVSEEAAGAIFEIRGRKPSSLLRKTSKPVLVVHGIKSIDDGIDILTRNNTRFLAAYHFSDLKTGKYLSQFIPAEVSFINHIPFDILVGPAFPTGHAVEPTTRYPMELFSRPNPAFITPTHSHSELLDAVQLTSSDTARTTALRALLASATSPLLAKKGPKQFSAAFGFFEQAFLLHFAIAVTSTLGIVGGSIWWIRSGKKLF